MSSVALAPVRDIAVLYPILRIGFGTFSRSLGLIYVVTHLSLRVQHSKIMFFLVHIFDRSR
jgi:hypothetical protein